MRFTAEQAHDDRTITWQRGEAVRVIAEHGCDHAAFLSEVGDASAYPAWTVLEWLGY